ncbi:hypothetical protein SCG7086_AS_00190 [Chlamydiales bacterium SCGC AG-110-P3]|nr:hypothetical protein SCG7086_AS_00190 [Chlamydiales bacterium SCGC AG-110-P3]
MNSRIMLVLMVSAVLVSGCARQYSDFFAYDDEGVAKPVVAVLPIRDSSWNSLPWNVSEELETGIWNVARRHGQLCCIDPQHVQSTICQLGDDVDIHAQDVKFYQQFTGCEFLVLIDLLEHNEMPYRRGEIEPLYIIDSDDVFVLSMKARVTVLDISGTTPRVILREIASSNHMIEKHDYDVDYIVNRWGSDGYPRTPIGMAHERLARDLTARIETVTAAIIR